jgi:hypothetical protein
VEIVHREQAGDWLVPSESSTPLVGRGFSKGSPELRVLSSIDSVRQRMCCHPCDGGESAVQNLGLRFQVFGGMQSMWFHLRVEAPSGSKSYPWEITCTLSIGRSRTDTVSAGSAFCGAAREYLDPGFVMLVLYAADRNGHSYRARQSFVGRFGSSDPGVLQVAERFSLRGEIADVALIGWSWVGSQVAASVVGCFASGSLKLTLRGGLRVPGEGNVRSFLDPSGSRAGQARKGLAGWLRDEAVRAVPSGAALRSVSSD